MMSKIGITFIHLLNNFSGSPNVLATIVEELTKKGFHTTIMTSFNNNGFLSNVKCSQKINIKYTFHKNIFLRFFQLINFQIFAAFEVMKRPKNEVIYVNTILPFLPAIFAKIRKMEVVYHIHEPDPHKSFFYRWCFWCAEQTAKKIISVSHYVEHNLSVIGKSKSSVIYNALSNEFVTNKIEKMVEKEKTIFMVCSARFYKGIYEFCRLSEELPKYGFILICDTTKEELRNLFPAKYFNYENLTILPTQKNLHSFYAKSSLILNLSIPENFIETFGLTILEGMSYGLPAIVPPVGGITELVDDGINGFQIDVNDFEKLKTGIISILDNEKRYQEMSQQALEKSKQFSINNQINTICYELSKF